MIAEPLFYDEDLTSNSLLLVLYRRYFNAQALLVVFKIGVESFNFFLGGSDACAGIACKHIMVKEVGKVARAGLRRQFP